MGKKKEIKYQYVISESSNHKQGSDQLKLIHTDNVNLTWTLHFLLFFLNIIRFMILFLLSDSHISEITISILGNQIAP